MSQVVKFQCGVMLKYPNLLQSKEPVDVAAYLVLMGMSELNLLAAPLGLRIERIELNPFKRQAYHLYTRSCFDQMDSEQMPELLRMPIHELCLSSKAGYIYIRDHTISHTILYF